jgi:hypothetical protein
MTYTDTWSVAAMRASEAEVLASESFRQNFLWLLGMISPDRNASLLETAKAWTDIGSLCSAMLTGTAPPFLIAFLACVLGTPLFISDELLDEWARCNGAQAECQRCGYRMPLPHRACVLCGASTGEPGGWARNRAVNAWLN